MISAKPWFEADREGLARILERRGKSFAVLELLQNAWDEEGVDQVYVTFEPVPGRPLASLTVIDNSPEGFADMAYAYTLFKPSTKVRDPEQRGRFSIGEKLVLAICTEATIASTKGTVRFTDEGRTMHPRKKRPHGTKFSATLRMTREEYDEAARALRTLIPPEGIVTTINGVDLMHRTPIHSFDATLPTELADHDGNLRATKRMTTVKVYDPMGGETATLYEMGLPVVETEDRWHLSVEQKVPVSLDRTNLITPGYLRDLRALVLNEMADRLTVEDAAESWVNDALEDEKVTADAVVAVLDKRYGANRVVYDPSDSEANRIALSKGYSIIGGNSFSKKAWGNIRRFEAARPAGQVTPSPKPFHPDGRALDLIEPENYTDAQRRFVECVTELHERLIGRSITVVLTNEHGWPYQGVYGSGKLIFNMAYLSPTIDNPSTLSTVLHEFGHFYGSHLTHAFDSGIASVSAALILLALREPEFFEPYIVPGTGGTASDKVSGAGVTLACPPAPSSGGT